MSIVVEDKLYLPGVTDSILYFVDPTSTGWSLQLACGQWPDGVPVGTIRIKATWQGGTPQTFIADTVNGGGIDRNGIPMQFVKVSGDWPGKAGPNGTRVPDAPNSMNFEFEVLTPVVSAIDFNPSVGAAVIGV